MGDNQYRISDSRANDRQTGAERRAHERQTMNAIAEMVDVDSGTSMMAQTSNVSRGGCFLNAPGPLSKGADVRVLLL
jgi:PilZ domain